MAFTVGMTDGITETEPGNTHIRKLVLGHALMSYVSAPASWPWQSTS